MAKEEDSPSSSGSEETRATHRAHIAGHPSPPPVETALQKPSHWPGPPRDLDELQVPHTLVTDLMLRHLRVHGVSTLTSLSASMRLSVTVIEGLFENLRKQQLVQVKGMTGHDYSFELTGAGRNMARESAQICNYAGPTPVTLQEYYQAVRSQAAQMKVNRERMRATFADLVVGDEFLDQIGPALVSQQSLFLYGPTGNGKTSYAERLVRAYRDAVLIPHAVEVDSQIIILHDPVVHRKTQIDTKDLDPRWAVCHRPCITAGGELVASMLDLQLDRASGSYLAPLQMKANNGMLIIDDLGRQALSPRELLNRWIVPLDRRVDYLTLSYGLKFEIPFELLVVFATNLKPSDLADEAFLRRIPNKINVGLVDDETFDLIFQRVTGEFHIPCDDGSAKYLRGLIRERGHELRACHPNDVCRIVLWIGEYEERPVRISRAELERAVDLYFAEESLA